MTDNDQSVITPKTGVLPPPGALPPVVIKPKNDIDFRPVLPMHNVHRMVRDWLEADMPTFDIGGMVVGNSTSIQTATLWMKSSGVIAGRPFVQAVFDVLGGGFSNQCKVEWNTDPLFQEGCYVNLASTGQAKIALASITGPVHLLLQGERTALNTLSRCSGVATAAFQAVQVAQSVQWKGEVAGTRKTTPGDFRLVEKYGLLVGGASTHRMDLSHMVMLKDNHIWACQNNITKAVETARAAAGFSTKIEVECQSLEEALEAARAGADIVMLDNFTPEDLKRDAEILKDSFPHVIVEASGGITVDTMAPYLSEHVDVVSQGSLTHGYKCLDYSMKITTTTTTKRTEATTTTTTIE